MREVCDKSTWLVHKEQITISLREVHQYYHVEHKLGGLYHICQEQEHGYVTYGTWVSRLCAI